MCVHVNKYYIYISCIILHTCYYLFLNSPPVRLRLLDFMSAVRPRPASSRRRLPPDPNSKPRIRVVPAGPQLQAHNRTGPRRTRTIPNSKHRIRVFRPDLNCKLVIAVVPAGHEQQAQDQSGPPDLNCKLVIAVVPAGPQPQRISEDILYMPERMSEDMPNTYARKNVRQNVRTYARKNARMNA